MKLSKEQINNVIWILVLVLILFTPLGFHLRVWANKVIAATMSADVIEDDEQITLEDYHWNLVDLEGKRTDFQSVKGKVAVVNVWATWCPPCVAELPSFVELYADYKDKMIFAFVANDEKTKVEAFLEKKGYALPVYFQASEAPQELMGSTIPVTYIISKSGKIVVDEEGAANWNSERIRRLLDELIAE